MKKREKLKKITNLSGEKKGIIRLDKSLFSKETIINLNNNSNAKQYKSWFQVCQSDTGPLCDGCASVDFGCNSAGPHECWSVAVTDCAQCGDGEGTLGCHTNGCPMG